MTTLASLSVEPLAPLWFVVPMAATAFLVVAAHLLACLHADMPPSRRRIRLANGTLILLTLPVLAYALCFVSPSEGRPFIIAWTVLAGSTSLVMALAWIDVINNLRLAARERQALGSLLPSSKDLGPLPLATSPQPANDASQAS
ncbi:MAG: hypothetical protein WCK33_03985 [Phycisphaerae bacterium]